MAKNKGQETIERPPVVAIMGHIDHGKSTLLDYIQKSNIVAGEAGGITQHVRAYEVAHKTKDGTLKKITFIDTPGHEAFLSSRRRGASIADIAILIVSAEEGVKEQTKESLKMILERKAPFVVAITKIDRPNANPNKVKQELAEANVFVEGYGGKIPCVLISAKTGSGVQELLEMLLLVAELEELRGEPAAPGQGFVLESHVDPKVGTSAVCVIKNGTLKTGDFIVIDGAGSKIKRITDAHGKMLGEATFSAPIEITGLSTLPAGGNPFEVIHDQKLIKELAAKVKKGGTRRSARATTVSENARGFLPVILRADTAGTLDAIVSALNKLGTERFPVKILASGIGAITEADMQTAATAADTIVIGFNVGIDKVASDIALHQNSDIKLFDVIYKITEYIADEVKKRTPKERVEEEVGRARIIKLFNKVGKNKQLVGGSVLDGVVSPEKVFIVIRNESEIARGKILELQIDKTKVKTAEKGAQFGALVESKMTLATGDILRIIETIEK